MGKLGVGLEALLKALVMVGLGTLADVCDGRERGYGQEVAAVETRLIGTPRAPCVYCIVGNFGEVFNLAIW